MRSCVVLLALCACNPEPTANIDSSVAVPSLTIAGIATQRAGSNAAVPAAGATIGAARNADRMPIASTTADATGAYSLAVATGGVPIDDIEATQPSFLPLHLYLARPIAADVTANLELVDTAALAAIAQNRCGTSLLPSVEVRAVDATGAAVPDAFVSTQPRALRYCIVDGVTYLVGISGVATVSATVRGKLIGSRTIEARAGVLTSVVLSP